MKKNILKQRAGLSTLKKYGKEHFSRIAKKRWRKVKRLKKKMEYELSKSS